MTNTPISRPAKPVKAKAAKPSKARPTKAQIVQQLATNFDRSAFAKPDPAGVFGVFLNIYFSLGLCALSVVMTLIAFGPIAAAFVWVLGVLLSTRAIRGMELMVHDGSHGSIVRGGGRALKLNDLICNLLFAWAVMQDTAAYRRQHVIHHRHYGSAQDPCLIRRVPALLAAAGREGGWVWAGVLLRELPRYVAEYYWEVGTRPAVMVRFLVWHLCIMAPVALWVGPWVAFLAWLAGFGLPFVITLPVLRAVAEAEEHDWENAEHSDFRSTYNNLGLVHRVLIHPFNDAYHLVHHLFGEVPTTRLAALHKILMKDPLYAEGLSRRSVLVR